MRTSARSVSTCATTGSCGIAGRPCALERHFESIVNAVAVIESPRMDDYVDAIREQT